MEGNWDKEGKGLFAFHGDFHGEAQACCSNPMRNQVLPALSGLAVPQSGELYIQCGQAPGPLHMPEINTHHTFASGHPCQSYYKVYDLFLYGEVQEC